MSHLTGKRVAILATDGFEDSELTSPLSAVVEHGAEAVVISTKTGTITGKKRPRAGGVSGLGRCSSR